MSTADPKMHATQGSKPPLLGAIEGGGTKFICSIGYGWSSQLAKIEIPTTTPTETLDSIFDFFEEAQKEWGRISHFGIGMFGPLDLTSISKTYGVLLNTAKRGWKGINVLDAIVSRFQIPASIATDVDCAALGEERWGAGKHQSSFIYITIGTGIGAGIRFNGAPFTSSVGHPEIGHMMVPLLATDKDFDGVCPFHGNMCIEGLASGPAIKARWGQSCESLGKDHKGMYMQADYLAILCVNLLAVLAPERIVLGGGVLKKEGLLTKVHDAFKKRITPYWTIGKPVEDWLVSSELDGLAGLAGAFELAKDAVTNSMLK